MLKKATIKNVTQYLQKFYLKNRINLQKQYPNSNQSISYFFVIKKFYEDFSKKFSFKIKKKTNKYFYDFFEKSLNEIDDYIQGPIDFIRKEEVYIENINEYVIEKLYPKTISLCYHNTEYFNQYDFYVYLVDNYNKIKNNLDENEQFMFKMIINYKYGFISKNNTQQIIYLMNGYNKFIKELLKNDYFLDIIYFDTVSIYTANTKEIDSLINAHIKKLYDIEIIHHNYGFFVKKKRYFLFDTIPKTIKGYDKNNNFYSEKQIKNIAYKLSFYNGKFRQFNRKNASDFVECIAKARKINSRNSKINRLI